jgi:outer membrane biosynthesis protein TonB
MRIKKKGKFMLKKIFISAVSILTLLLSSLNIAPAREIVEVPHWQKKIVTVYISPEGGDAKIRPMIKSSFAKWQGNSSGHIRFQYLTKPEDKADIVITFPKKEIITPTKKEAAVTPKKEAVTSPQKETAAAPKKDAAASPQKETAATPKKDAAASPQKETAVTPKKEAATPPQKVPATPSKENTETPKQLTSVSTQISGNEITGAKYFINTESDAYKKSSSAYMSKVLLHDVGTILGLPTNTTKKSSIMYSPVTESQEIMKIDVRKLFSISEWSYAKRNIEAKNEEE